MQIFPEPMRVPDNFYSFKDWETFKDFPSFYPYLCEFGYRSLADHVIDPNHPTFDPLDVRQGDSIYCAVWYLDWFVNQVHDKIPCPYILITCDVGSWLPSPDHLKLVYDPKVVCWFGKNMVFSNHPKLFQLPMGQFYYLWATAVINQLDVFDDLVLNPTTEKDIFLYLNYTERDHGRRKMITDKFANKSYCYNRNRPRQRISFSEFWKEVSRSKFVISPLGLEIDCTRTWECFALGAIPIVEHSFLDPLYDDLPILLIHDWDEIDEAFLNQKYLEIYSKNHNLKRAFIDHWANLIYEKQKAARRGDVSCSSLEVTQFDYADLAEMESILQRYGKSHSLLIYQGNMTCLRPFQVAMEIQQIKQIQLIDLWTERGYPFIKKFTQDSQLFKSRKIKICSSKQRQHLLRMRKNKSLFLDLTHFRHELLTQTPDLDDFFHSLEHDLYHTYGSLLKGDLLFGNMANDPYVQQVIERLRNQHHLQILISGNFWHCCKN